jgi:hypothetical protein
MRHLLDHEMQAWLEGNDPEQKRRLKDHVEGCAECRENIGQYKLLYNSLECQEAPFVPSTFADSVMNRLPGPSHAFIRFLPERILFAFLWAGAGWILLHSIRWDTVLPQFVTWTRIFGRISEIMRFPAGRLAGLMGTESGWLFLGTGMLIVMMLLDRLIQFRMRCRIH